MKKQLEFNVVYETRDRENTGVLISNCSIDKLHPCIVLYTNKSTGKQFTATTTNSGIVYSSSQDGDDLIIPEPEPEPKWRPWELYEIPIGGILRNKATGIRHLITTVNPSADLPIEVSARRISIELAYAHYEYHNGTSWQPCGVLVS